MLKVGIIGVGRMGKTHAADLVKIKDVQISGVYDIKPEQADAFQKMYPTARIMNNAAELANSPEIDLIVITSPTYCHKEGLLPAMASGKPIFCEKPLCRTREELNELAPLIRNYKNLFAIGFVRRYSANVLTMKKLIDEGKIGKLICGSVCCLMGHFKRERGDWFADYSKSGGVMLDMLAHHCDLQNYMVGKVRSIYARALQLPETAEKPRDYVSCTAVFEGGYISNMECSWLRGGPGDTYMTVCGEKGALKLSDSQGLLFYDIGGAETKIVVDENINGGLSSKISGGMHAEEMLAIVNCIRNGSKPYAGAEDAINAMNFCLAMIESSENDKIIRF